eukprot:3306743-Pleurochrysis_carterae.AAC.1
MASAEGSRQPRPDKESLPTCCSPRNLTYLLMWRETMPSDGLSARRSALLFGTVQPLPPALQC